MSFRSAIEKRWYAKKPGVLSALGPLEFIYGGVSRLRRARLEGKQTPLRVPVVVVGNITVGGTGKTPLIIALIKHLQKNGFRPGVVSRGYGRNSQYENSVHCVGSLSTPAEAGDEPILIFHQTNCPVAVADDRLDAAQRLIENFSCDVILSDDGLQHYRLPRDMEIAVIDGRRTFGNEHLLPVGPLREPVERLNEVDCIIVNGDLSKLTVGSLVKKSVQVSVKPVGLCDVKSSTRLSIEAITDAQDPIAISGIGNPDKFFSTLKGLGVKFETQVFEDHHNYVLEDIIQFVGRDVIMTSKDAVKIKQLLKENPNNEKLTNTGLWYLDIQLDIPNAFLDAFANSVRKLYQQKKTAIKK